MAEEHQVVYRDAFLGKIQKDARLLETIRFPLVIIICRGSETFSAHAFTESLKPIYCNHGSISILTYKQNKLMLMFSDDRDATNAYANLHGQTISDANGPILKFSIWHPMDDLGYDVADHHVFISISGLPLHLWKEDVVEQILHPYCALSYLSEDTRTRRNLSSYAAFGWSQKRIAMPRRISLKVTKEISGDASLVDTAQCKEVFAYNLIIDAVGFLCDAATECSCNIQGLNARYEPSYDPNMAQCFLTEPPENEDLLEDLKHAVLATAAHTDHGYQKEEVQELLSGYLGCDVKVHRLSEIQFLILPPEKFVREVAKEILLQMQTFELSLTSFKLDPWNQTSISIVERLPIKTRITVNEIPAHLCTPKLVRFILSPYCAVQIDTDHVQPIVTAEKFTCIAWTDSAAKIPTRIMAALFTEEPGAEDLDNGYSSTDLRITQLINDITVLHDNHHE